MEGCGVHKAAQLCGCQLALDPWPSDSSEILVVK